MTYCYVLVTGEVCNLLPPCCSLFGWDHVTQGLVQLGFTLMDAFGPKIFGTFYSLNKNTLGIIKGESSLIYYAIDCVSIVCVQIH